jgi:hypothetical protein
MTINWIELLFLSIRKPRNGIAQLLQLSFNNSQLVQIVMLATCLVSIFTFVFSPTFMGAVQNTIGMQESQTRNLLEFNKITPINIVQSYIISFVVRCITLKYLGQLLNGNGDVRNSILSLAWFDIIRSVGLALGFIGLWVSPELTIISTLFGTIWLVWISINFISILHSFGNFILIFIGLLVGYCLTLFVLILLPSIF